MVQRLITVTKWIGGGRWAHCNMHELRANDMFKLYEVNGVEITPADHRTYFIALSDGYVNKAGIGTVEVSDEQVAYKHPTTDI